MNKTYLSDEKIKSIKAYLNTVMPKDVRETIKNLYEKHGLELFQKTTDNKEIIWRFVSNEMTKDETCYNCWGLQENNLTYKELLHKGHYHEARQILDKYVEKHYKKEWQVVTEKFDPSKIWLNLNLNVKNDNKIEPFSLKEIILSKSLDEYFERFEKKNCDPELTKISDNICKYIDSVYSQKRGEDNYNRYQEAVKTYMISGEKYLLHNILNN
jgi:hypothetical protein